MEPGWDVGKMGDLTLPAVLMLGGLVAVGAMVRRRRSAAQALR